jgi:hypothetical protein
MRIFIPFLALLLSALMINAQEYTLTLKISNMPSEEIYLAKFYGDRNNLIDTARVDSTGTSVFTLKAETPAGMYRVFFTPEIYIDLIYNSENIFIESDFEDIFESLAVKESIENQCNCQIHQEHEIPEDGLSYGKEHQGA